jgi:type II secretory pathway pseudopilin PulG
MLKCSPIPKNLRRRGEQGYILLYLMFLVAVLALSLVTILPQVKFVLQRDQEQEMVHRGEQYRRAIRRYYRKFGSYPPSLDVLESSNDMRFLRKRYKDPMNHNKDFKTLTQMDLRLTLGNALGTMGGGIPGAQTLGQPIGAAPGAPDPNAANGNPPAPPAGSDPNSTDPSQPPANTDPNSNSNTNSNLPFSTISGQPGGQTFGGGAIVGVASVNPGETIRIYNKKNHYKDWQFIYDPASDRGGLLTGPYQPTLQTFTQGINQQNGVLPGSVTIPGMGAPGTGGMQPQPHQ